MAEYRLTSTDEVIRVSDGAVIPDNPDSPGRVEYEAWLAVPGNVPDPYVPAPPVKSVQRIAIVRFTVAAGVVTTTGDTVGIGAVTRISAGRYRAFYDSSDPDLSLLPSVCVRDAADVRARVSSRTTSFVEVRTVNAANAAVDVAEVIVTFDKVLTT
jgi:hypothetical protein